ncbi:MAG: acyl-CoA thioesterase [Chlamydiota bacterium]
MADLEGKSVSSTALNENVEIVFPNDLNPSGSLFGGRVLESCDRICAIVAKRHSRREVVTLAADHVRFRAPAEKGHLLIYRASVNRTWTTSMEIGIRVEAENPLNGEKKHILTAFFTFVAIGTDGKPIKIAPVIPESKDEIRRYREADIRRQKRLFTKEV